MAQRIKKIDHAVITTQDIDSCLIFYKKLGFEAKIGKGRYELFADGFKINVHILGKELSPHALNVQPGSADLCFEVVGNIDDFRQELQNKGIIAELGTVTRTGFKGMMNSMYVRDPDGNLIEFCSYA